MRVDDGRGSDCSIGSEASDVLRREQGLESVRRQLHEEIELLEIMSARASLGLLNLVKIGEIVRISSQDSECDVTVARLRSLGMEIEKEKASTQELRREILEVKRERIEVLDGADGFLESHPAMDKYEGSRSREKRPARFEVVFVGMATLVMALSVVVARVRGNNSRK